MTSRTNLSIIFRYLANTVTLIISWVSLNSSHVTHIIKNHKKHKNHLLQIRWQITKLIFLGVFYFWYKLDSQCWANDWQITPILSFFWTVSSRSWKHCVLVAWADPWWVGSPLIKIHWKSDGLSKHMINQHHRWVIWALDFKSWIYCASETQ